jgi:hypothetical protein
VKTQTLHSMLALAMSLNLATASAATPAIGTILAKGAFRVDNATVTGNATLFEGSVVETAVAPSSVQLNSGARVLFGADSRGRLFGDRLVLEKGATNLENSTGFRLVALGLTIQPDRAASTGSVIFDSPRRLRVSAVTGSFRVLNTSGQLVANIAAGAALAFEPQPGPSNVSRVTGCLESKSGHYLLTDEVTNVTVEVAGNGLADEAGNKVEVTGASDPTATPATNATQLIRAREVHRIAKGCGNSKTMAAAAGTGGATAGAAAASGGIAVTTVAVVGGVAAAAVVGGLAATSSQKDAPSPASR